MRKEPGDPKEDPMEEQIALGEFSHLKHLMIEIENVVIDLKEPTIDLEKPTLEDGHKVKQGDALKKAVDALKKGLDYLNSEDRKSADSWIMQAEIYLATYEPKKKK